MAFVPMREGKVQIIVPVYNEGRNVCVLYEGLKREGIEYDSMKFVYDMDEDTTLPFIEEIGQNDLRIRAEKNEFGRGVLNAFRWSFLHCEPGPVLVLMGDNSDKLSIIPEMIRLWEEGATVVCPSRYMKGGEQHGGGLLKSRLSRIAGRSMKLFGFPTSDATNNFKLYDGEWVKQQKIESTGGFEIALELSYKAFSQGKKIAELPTVWLDRTMGKSQFKLLSWMPRYIRWYLRSLLSVLRGRLSGTLRPG